MDKNRRWDITTSEWNRSKVELERRQNTTFDGHIVGLFYLPNNSHTPFVTWLIIEDRNGIEQTFDGHYYITIAEAIKDYEKRL